MKSSNKIGAGTIAICLLVMGSVGCSSASTVPGDLPTTAGEPAPSSSAPYPTGSPNPVAVVGRSPDLRVASVLFDADVSIPGVYVAAIADEDNTVRVLYHARSSSAEEFRAFVDARTDDSPVRWEDSEYSPMDQQAMGRAVVEEAWEKGLSPSGASFDRGKFEFAVFVTKEPSSEPVFTKRYLAGREVAVRVEVFPGDGLD